MRPCSVAALAVLLAVASCASVPPAAVSPVPTTAAGSATILAVRPIVASAADGGAWRALLLNGAADPAGPAPPAGASAAEFIVREDSGATVSIVQSNAAGLRPGERVVITRPSASAGRPALTRLL